MGDAFPFETLSGNFDFFGSGDPEPPPLLCSDHGLLKLSIIFIIVSLGD